jgi:hypothetical protein
LHCIVDPVWNRRRPRSRSKRTKPSGIGLRVSTIDQAAEEVARPGSIARSISSSAHLAERERRNLTLSGRGATTDN